MRRIVFLILWFLSLAPKAIAKALTMLKQCLIEAIEWAGRVRKSRRARRWFFHIGKPKQIEEVRLPTRDLERLLKRSRDLRDLDDLTRFGLSFRMAERDFTVTRSQVEEILRRILEAHPPFLFLGQTLPDPDQTSDAPPRIEKIRKTERIRVHGPVELLVPEERPIVDYFDLPPGNQSLRPARGMNELPRALLLDRVLPPRLQIERLAHGEMEVIEYARVRPHVEFVPRVRRIESEEEREIEVEIELEATDPDSHVQLVYFLVDTSASMKGIPATVAAAAFCAIHRANMAVPARYYMRTFAESVEPGWTDPPWRADTLAERETLFERIFTLNFNGSSTHTGWAIEAACRDIAEARQIDANLGRAAMVLITDGRSDLQPDTIALFIRTGVPLHTIMVSRDHNHDLERISDSVTILSGLPDLRDESDLSEVDQSR